jgi:hypothetical protein
MARKTTGFKEDKQWRREYFQRVDAAVVRSGIELRDNIKARFAKRKDGYTTGNFVTGGPESASDIQMSPLETRNNVRRISVFSPATRVGDDGTVHHYPAYWEFGHWNLFTGEFEHIRTFEPAAEEVGRNIPEILKRQFRRGRRVGGIEFGIER